MKAELIGTDIVMDSEYRDRDMIKTMPGARFRDGKWRMPVSWANCWVLRSTFGDRLETGPALVAWAAAELQDRVAPAMEARNRALDPANDCEGDSRLYPYQRTGVEFLVRAQSALLADEMGTGKTVQAIMALEAAGAYPALIVCPNTVKRNWAAEFERWAPHRSVVVVSGGAVTRRKQLETEADVHIVNWNALRIHSRLDGYGSIALTDKEKTPGELNRAWGAVIADECHRLKDPKAKQTRAAWAIARTAARRIGLTGTPVANNPADFWSILHFLDEHEWPARTKFIDRYCLTAWNAFGGVDVVGLRPEMREEFFRVVEPRVLRRVKEVVLPFLPSKVYERRTIELNQKQRRAYNEMRDGLVAEVANGQLMAFDTLSQFGRLAQFASAFAELDADGNVRLAEPSSKLDALMELIDETDEPIVVFAASRQLLELGSARLAKAKIPHGMVTGAVAEADRQWAIEAFQDGQLRVIMLTYGAGAEGITLTRSRLLVRLQRSWSLIENTQAEDRIHRPGAERHSSLLIVDIMAEDTIDDSQQETMELKGDMLEMIVRDKSHVEAILKGAFRG